jgi:threonine dehydrogenase-like Zn-dependent dehydrogenase
LLTVFVRGSLDFVLEDIPTPEPGPDEVLVRVHASGICGSDLHYHRAHGVNAQPRLAGGHEVSGTVVEVGSSGSPTMLGRRVVIEPVVGCGRCAHCSTGSHHLCVRRRHLQVGFSEFAVVPGRSVLPLPDKVSFEAGALADCLAVGIHAIGRAEPGRGDTIVVIGDGTIGLVVLSLVARAHHRRLVVVGRHDRALALARDLGADFTVNCGREDPVLAVRQEVGDMGAEIVYECVGGDGESLRRATHLVRAGGTIAVLGSFPQPSPTDLKALLLKEVTLTFCISYGARNGVREFDLALQMITDQRVPVEGLITHRFPLAAVREAFDAALDKETSGAIKVMITDRRELAARSSEVVRT